MDEKNVHQAQRSFWDAFWNGAFLVLTENKRREMAIAQIIAEAWSKPKDKKSKAKKETENLSDGDVSKTEMSPIKTKKDEKPLDELEFIKKKWEMRTKSKL